MGLSLPRVPRRCTSFPVCPALPRARGRRASETSSQQEQSALETCRQSLGCGARERARGRRGGQCNDALMRSRRLSGDLLGKPIRTERCLKSRGLRKGKREWMTATSEVRHFPLNPLSSLCSHPTLCQTTTLLLPPPPQTIPASAGHPPSMLPRRPQRRPRRRARPQSSHLRQQTTLILKRSPAHRCEITLT